MGDVDLEDIPRAEVLQATLDGVKITLARETAEDTRPSRDRMRRGEM